MAQHISLYRKYRPDSWDKVIGQDHIVKTLINQLNTDTISHAYLFTGTRGTGKTTSAKIFARSINCTSPVNGSPCGKCPACLGLQNPSNLDILEMDAASNNRVEDIRELCDKIHLLPTVGKYKVYIIDEVHMLSGSAFNAFLKTLEEPPKHAVFILATTEVHKLPQTILSRCMRFDFRLVSKKELTEHVAKIFDAENYPYEIKAVEQIAIHGEGSVRDTLSIADMCMSYAPDKLTYASVLEVLGASDFKTIFTMARAILSGDVAQVLNQSNAIYERGKGMDTIAKELCSFFRELLSIKNIPGYRASLGDDEYSYSLAMANNFDNYRIARILEILSSVESILRNTTQPRIVFDACLVRATELYTEHNVDAILSRVSRLEKAMHDGSITIGSEPKADTSAHNANFEANLNKFARPIEDSKPIFEEAIVPKKDEKAEMLVGQLLSRLREDNKGLLYRALAGQKNYELNGTTLIFTVKDVATLSSLKDDANYKYLNTVIKEIATNEYAFEFQTVDNRSVASHQDRATLKEIFGDTLTIK